MIVEPSSLMVRKSDASVKSFEWHSYGCSSSLHYMIGVFLRVNITYKAFMIALSILSEKAMAPHSSTLAWKIPWTEEPSGLQSIGSLRAGQD